ncbi:hypothetical protein FLONG3_6892 [Fusarium longipes]|uniref:Uncharacterized protein n=1 Tax=Fusarium longipes TaxID=694270 RepID=A0A395SHT5_9HYPO|nr:hypothetical protein FLONG3_6892 [Fusarium longipes]
MGSGSRKRHQYWGRGRRPLTEQQLDDEDYEHAVAQAEREVEEKKQAAAQAQREYAAAQRNLRRLQNEANSSRRDRSSLVRPAGGNNRGRGANHNGTNPRRSPVVSRSSNVGKSGRGSFGGVIKSESVKPKSGLLRIPETEKRADVNSQSLTTTRVVNTSLGGGNNSRFFAPPPTGGSIGMARSPEELADAGARILSSGSSGVQFHVEPMIDERTARSGITSHFLKDCLSAPSGYLRGCICCNVNDHLVDTCETFEKLLPAEKVGFLVKDRAWRPALETTRPWWEYLKEHMLATNGQANVPQGFPWSADFAKAKYQEREGQYLKGLQARWDNFRNSDHLPEDPLHDTKEAVARQHWDGQIWPANPASTEPAGRS